MKTETSPSFFSLQTLVFLVVSALAIAFLAACETPTEAKGFTGISGDRIGDDYVYYPRYEVYYVPTRKEYVYYDSASNTWIRTTNPNQVWVKDIAGTAYVKMDFHDAPEGHHQDVVRRYPQTWVPPEAVPGVPARTTNDDVREGKR
jgi:hypothetical protein